ncbi:HP1 family phage holin [Hahella ganghwensis]|uniref:HP1 family phage holin n=1 Tax=Hahella ganghwensis TaxID=286420 RepID=UPI0003770095|nr:HP1 family phage holin [Hahella ganghwensis]
MIPDKTTAASYFTSVGIGVAGSMTFNQWLALGGFGLAAATFCVNWYYKRKEFKLKEEYHNHMLNKD